MVTTIPFPPPLEATQPVLQEYAEVLRINAIALDEIGLLRGKAGVSLALFELAALFHDEALEQEATHYLETCLVARNDDLSFDTGWGGVAYATRYLLNTQLLEMDYGEVMGNIETRIVERMQQLSVQKNAPTALFEVCSYAPLFADRHHPAAHQLLTHCFDELFAHYSQVWHRWFSETKDFIDAPALAEWHHLVHLALSMDYSPSPDTLAYYRKCVKTHRTTETLLQQLRLERLRSSQTFARHPTPDLKRPLPYTEQHALLFPLHQQIALHLLAPSLRTALQPIWQSYLDLDVSVREQRLTTAFVGYSRYSWQNGSARLLLFWVWLYLPEGEHRHALAQMLS